MYSYGPLHMAVQKQDDQHEHTFRNYVRIQDVVQKTCLRRWTIGKSGERGSGISVLPAWHDDDDEIATCCKRKKIQIKIEILTKSNMWLIPNRTLKTFSVIWPYGRPARTYLQQPCADTGCSLKDLPGAMDDSDGWGEREREKERERERESMKFG